MLEIREQNRNHTSNMFVLLLSPTLDPADALDADSKNYHAWAHRQVVVAAAGAWQQEMEYLEGLLQQDVRNNSAWNQRAFVIRVRGLSAAVQL